MPFWMTPNGSAVAQKTFDVHPICHGLMVSVLGRVDVAHTLAGHRFSLRGFESQLACLEAKHGPKQATEGPKPGLPLPKPFQSRRT